MALDALAVAEQLFSSSWHRVSDLTPKLRPHAQVYRQLYRGEIWFVLRDRANERFHRFRPAAHYAIALMDGERTVEEIWHLAGEELHDDAPTQDQVIELLGQLHAADVLQCDVSPDARELFDRWERHESQQVKGRLMSPFAIRIPLIDPDRFLTSTVDIVRPLFSPAGAALWLAFVVPAIVLAGVHWTELTENLLDRVMAPGNLVIVWLLFPAIKILHELGHGYAAKVFGSPVHDMGVMLLIFTPVPYVDASSSWSFSSKYRRALVGAGGMVVEIFIASVAFYVWLAAEPGSVRSIAYNVIMIAGVTTVLFNANPLLRFDGYYILSDLAELPNLRLRANKYWSYLVERYLFGQGRAEPPRLAEGERTWFVLYPVAALVYRVIILVAILTWILDQFFIVGLMLGGFAVVGWALIPLYKGSKYLFTSPALWRIRSRAIGVCLGLALTGIVVVSLLPFPLRTLSEGVVWIPEEGFVRSGADGFISEIVATPGAWVREGDLLVVGHDPVLDAEYQRWNARIAELEVRYGALRTEDVAAAEIVREELAYARQEVDRVQEKLKGLRIRSLADGFFVMPRDEDWSGRFVHQGEILAHVIDFEDVSVRTVVTQDDADLVRFDTEDVEIRFAEELGSVKRADLVRVVPAASDSLPSVALGTAGGGEVPSDPRDPDGDHSMISFFEVELRVSTDDLLKSAGGRVYIRFDHGTEPLARQWYRDVRQLFLSRFQV